MVLGIDKPPWIGKVVVRVPVASRAVLPCDFYGKPPPKIEWWMVEVNKLIGSYDSKMRDVSVVWSRKDVYRVLVGGYLSISKADRNLVGKYRCTAANTYVSFREVFNVKMF